MMDQLEPQPHEGAALDTLVETERRLEGRLAQAHADAQARIQLACGAAQIRLVSARQVIAEQAAARLEDRKRQLDVQLAGETCDLEDRITGVVATLEPLKRQLCQRMLAKVLGT